MKEVVGKKLKIKASGGIRTLEDAQQLIEAGADRIGCSASVAIMEEYLK
jgi:deoxyribose-phosphate aldolase